MASDNGPYESERQAAHAARAVAPPEDGRSILSAAQNRRLLDLACEAAGIESGEYDRRILAWLAGFEDATVVVFAGLIRRAREAGEAAATAARATEWGVRFTMSPGDLVESEVSSEEAARTAVANMRDRHPEFGAVLVCRVAAVPAGDWEEVPDA